MSNVGRPSCLALAIRPDAGRLAPLLRFAVLHVPGIDLALCGFDFFVSDPLYHFVETGMRAGLMAGAEGRYSHASNAGAAATAVEPVAATGGRGTACRRGLRPGLPSSSAAAGHLAAAR